jgi:cupin 2 domain-containing protein
MSTKLDNVFALLPDASRQEVFETLVRTEQVHIERIASAGQATPVGQWYDQARAEWILLLQGQAKLRFASGEVFELQAGDYLAIPAHCKHRVDWTSNREPTLWLAVHYS